MARQRRIHKLAQPLLRYSLRGWIHRHDPVHGKRIGLVANLFPFGTLHFDGSAVQVPLGNAVNNYPPALRFHFRELPLQIRLLEESYDRNAGIVVNEDFCKGEILSVGLDDLRVDYMAADGGGLAHPELADAAEVGAVFIPPWDVVEELSDRGNTQFGQKLRRGRTAARQAQDL